MFHQMCPPRTSTSRFPIEGVLGGRAITIGPAMVSLEGANSGDPSGDPLGILGGSESKTADPGVLYPKKPKDSGGSCATSVPLYNIKRKDVWERGEVGVAGCADLKFYCAFVRYLKIYCTFVLRLTKSGCTFDPWPKSDPTHMEANALSFFGSKQIAAPSILGPKNTPKTKWRQMRFRSLAPKSGCTFDPWPKKGPKIK